MDNENIKMCEYCGVNESVVFFRYCTSCCNTAVSLLESSLPCAIHYCHKKIERYGWCLCSEHIRLPIMKYELDLFNKISNITCENTMGITKREINEM